MRVQNNTDPWLATLIGTGQHTRTGDRIERAARELDDDSFWLTYRDGVAGVALTALVASWSGGAGAGGS